MIYKKINHNEFDVIISCGRKSVIPSIHLKNTANKKVFNIHIQDPKVDLNHFDFIVAPEHDSLNGQNVISNIATVAGDTLKLDNLHQKLMILLQ